MIAMNNINLLLDKYFSGSTSQEEDTLLREYFTGNQVTDACKQYTPLFVYIDEAKQRVESQIPQKTHYRRLTYLISVAAAVFLFFGIYRFQNVATPPTAAPKSFVMINGVYSEDPELVSYHVTQVIDRFFQAENDAFSDTRNAIYQAYKVLDDCLASFDVIMQTCN